LEVMSQVEAGKLRLVAASELLGVSCCIGYARRS
jgi:hypothetical protein